ncbi:sentrin-specific protease 7 isoform X2 [Manis pentadactyla]|uniref:sentrin-specific protease 7 isoform X2 n=1 Tax=Manis pentadactyla TaxID=143292 RepID=UPI00255C4DFE|nr:sentrin-specific protease 7 isoform X2 [Manis pentadactyla]KAI5134915.1 Sentrin-Specific Protease 7 [Manis pentadactyla]
MDKGKAGRRRSSSEIVTEGKRKKSSSSELHKITKMLNAKPEEVRVQSPLPKLRSSGRWNLPLQGWERSLRNKVLSLDHKSKKGVCGHPVASNTSPERQLKVMLTNVLWTDLGRKFRKTLPRNDANLCDANKVQSDSLPSTSVDSLETCQKLEPLHQSLNLSKRIPRVILTNVLGTELGRKYIKTSSVTEAILSDTDNLQSEQLSSSSDGSLESCQNLNPHKNSFLSERSSQPSKTVDYKYAQQSVYTKGKRRDDDSISLVISNTQPKDLSSGSRGSDHLEEGSRHKDYTYSDSKMEPTLISKKRKKRLRSNLPDSHDSSLYKSAEQTKEQENDSTVSTEFEKSSEDYHQDPKLLEEITSVLIESDFTEVSLLNNQELALTAAPKNTSDCSTTETFESPISTDPVGNSTLGEKDENELNTIENPVLSEQSEGNQSLISTEPIVVSSDDEGPVQHKSSEILKLQPKQDNVITNETESASESALSELPLITCESVQASSELCPYNPVMENISCIVPSNEMDQQLDFVLTSVYIGKIKGASKGCVTLTPKYIKIPFQVSLNEVSLLVDTTHLKRFGLWKSKDDDHSKRSHAILFLWVSSNYLQEIQTQLENSMLSQQSKSTEFIFLELHNPISQREELKLKDIMTEISTTNGELELSYPLSWVQAFPLFQKLSSKESSFIHYYCASTCSFPAAAEEMKMRSVSQPTNTDTPKPTYTFLQKQSSGCYSLSITSNPDEEWREVRHTGPVQKLIVYPPPPTKGGLGVTSEDLECLEEGEFLNDVIIDFYLKYLILEKASDELVERSHIFSSFFYKCLTRKENNLTEDNPNLSMAQRRHKRVRTWTRHINIFNKDYIFVPVNESSHWYLAVICFPWLEEAVYEDIPQTTSQPSQPQQSQLDNKTIDNDLQTTSALSLGTEDSQSTDTNMTIPKKMCKRPCILILDSLKAASIQNTVQNLREYLEVEWEVKRKTHREFSKTNMVDLCPKVPKQDNSSDCGVYLLQYVESFLKDPIVNFELPIHLEKWFPRHVIKTKREDIRELILKLHLQQQKGSSS